MGYWHGKIRFQELRITNFRQFKSFNLSFHERLTVLIGENGSGKTTVLEAVAKCMRLFSEAMKQADLESGIVRNFFFVTDINNEEDISQIDAKVLIKIDNGTETVQIKMDDIEKRKRLEEINQSIQYYMESATREIEELRMSYDDNLGEYERQKEKIEDWRDQKISELLREEKTITGKPYGESELSWNVMIERNIRKEGKFSDLSGIEIIARELAIAQKSSEDISIPFFKYYPCRDLDNTPYHIKNNVNNQNKRVNIADEETTNIDSFTTWYRRVERQSAERNDFRLLNEIHRAIYELLSDGETHRFDNMRLSYLNEEKPDGELWINKNNIPVRLEQLSSGETMLLLLVSDLARRFVLANPLSVEPYKTGSAVVLIDEVDLHLHPQWQIKVLNKLCGIFPNAQFLVTTHSPLVITHLDPNDSKVGLIRNSNENQLVQWLSNYAGRTLEDFIYEFYGVKKRPETTQQDIDELFDLIDTNKIEEARSKLDILRKQLGDRDAAILDAETLIENA